MGSNPYIGQLAPAVGGGLGGLPRRNSASIGSVAGDPYFDKVSGLFHFESLPVVDIKGLNTVTVTNTVTISIGSGVAGTNAVSLDTSGYLTLAQGSHLAFDGDFTIEGWFSNTDWARSVAVFGGASDQAGRFRVGSNGTTLECEVYGFGVVATAPRPVNNTLTHIALGRKSGVMRLYTSTAGAASYTGANTAGVVMNNANNLRVGNNYLGNVFNGIIDEFRITKGIDRYSSAPSTSPFPDYK